MPETEFLPPSPSEPLIPELAPDKKQHIIFSAIGSVILVILGIILWNILLTIGISIAISLFGYFLSWGAEKFSAEKSKFKKFLNHTNVVVFSLVFGIFWSEVFWTLKECWDAGWILQWLKVKDPITGFGWSDLLADQVGIAIGILATGVLFYVFYWKPGKRSSQENS